jgi:hypothetical protein
MFYVRLGERQENLRGEPLAFFNIYIIKIIFANEIKNKYIIIMLNKNLTIYTVNH